MKNINLLILLSFFTFTSCDIVKPPFEEGNNNSNNTTTENPTTPTNPLNPTEEDLSGINDEPNYRRAYLEDFTGHQCGNCPRAAETALSLHNQYGNKLVTVAIHAGFFARFTSSASKYFYNFKTAQGDELDQYFGNSDAGLPNGLISRKKVNNNYILSKDDWISHVDALTKETAKIKIKIKNEFVNDSRNVKSTIYIKNMVELQGNYKMAVYIAEDSIINWQKDYSLPSGQQDIENYAHRHVFRGAINNTWGEDLFNNTTIANTFTKKEYSFTLDANFQAKKCYVVVIVYQAESLEIIQANETKISK